MKLAERERGNPKVVEYFAFTHDLRRLDDYMDPGHGIRAADMVKAINDELIHLEDDELDLLVEACGLHSKGFTEADITFQRCWDADRLDLLRVGISVDPLRLCTKSAVLLAESRRV